jgi:very-short-patch-repair endonuclease
MHEYLTWVQLRAEGMRRREVTAAERSGFLRRVRRGRYVRSSMPAAFVRAAELGGRLDCVSLLHELGVFVFESPGIHLQMDRDASRTPTAPPGVTRHWRDDVVGHQALAADIVAALVQAVRCQQPAHAIATLDSSLHLGLVDEADLAQVFRRLPTRFQILRPHLDARSESGPETLLRLLVRRLGVGVRIQVRIDTVGRVDLLVDGWLIVECDSRAHHSDPVQQVRDRRRDLAAAALGFVTLRVLGEDVMYRPEAVLAAVRSLIARYRPA